ncbi:unnamed protein product [Protopolystoma xenopodis]|uniref:Uncharacterized protein n=1 Tax=Protopolystoma xenopodis TaxID=117903 RepID=A0A3S5A6W2_9PLAT|nr:unnamed protein product [Protopolystoma xenopodis]
MFLISRRDGFYGIRCCANFIMHYFSSRIDFGRFLLKCSDLQDRVGLTCWGSIHTSGVGNWSRTPSTVDLTKPPDFSRHWRGLDFFNSTTRELSLPEVLAGSEGNTILNVSASILEHVDILYAGEHSDSGSGHSGNCPPRGVLSRLLNASFV